MIRKKQVIILNNYMTTCLTNVLDANLRKIEMRENEYSTAYVYYDKIYLYSKNLEQEKYTHL